MSGRIKYLPLALSLFIAPIARGQTTTTISSAAPRDVQAVVLAGGSLRALADGTTLTDLALTGSATTIAGSDQEIGSVSLLASGSLQSRVVLTLSGGQRTEIRNGPAGDWIGMDGVERPMALHNCLPDAAWFYPGLSFQALNSDPGLGLTYVGLENKNGLAVQHLRLFRVLPAPSGDAATLTSIQQLSAEDIYLDSVSLLPLFLDFSIHPDNDATLDLPVEIAFSGYKQMSGITVPTRIQKFVQNNLVLDLTISSVTLNSGLPASDFAIATPGGGK